MEHKRHIIFAIVALVSIIAITGCTPRPPQIDPQVIVGRYISSLSNFELVRMDIDRISEQIRNGASVSLPFMTRQGVLQERNFVFERLDLRAPESPLSTPNLFESVPGAGDPAVALVTFAEDMISGFMVDSPRNELGDPGFVVAFETIDFLLRRNGASEVEIRQVLDAGNIIVYNSGFVSFPSPIDVELSPPTDNQPPVRRQSESNQDSHEHADVSAQKHEDGSLGIEVLEVTYIVDAALTVGMTQSQVESFAWDRHSYLYDTLHWFEPNAMGHTGGHQLYDIIPNMVNVIDCKTLAANQCPASTATDSLDILEQTRDSSSSGTIGTTDHADSHVVVYISGKDFDGGTVGLAWVDTLNCGHAGSTCGFSDYNHGIIQAVGNSGGGYSATAYELGLVNVHEIGHILGCNHESDNVTLDGATGPNIMNAFVSPGNKFLFTPACDAIIAARVNSRIQPPTTGPH